MERVARSSVPAITADQMREVDRIMIEDLRIELVQMMENAGRSLAEVGIGVFGAARATVLAGPGGNGGGGLVAARHLANRGVDATVVLARARDDFAGVPRHQLDILERMGVAVRGEPLSGDLIVDALIGYSLRGDPRGRTRDLIAWANADPAPVLALDTPSGLDVTTGRPGSPCIRADATLTLALPKSGLLESPEWVGRLFLADISVPPTAYESLGVDVPALFVRGPVVELI